jgi:alkylation response protein AidB-like acyl-CoA dehydrogenase
VDFEQSEEQQMVRDLVRDWAEAELTPTIEVRDKQQQAPVEEWQRFCELGLQGITIPEQHGGNPLDDICEAIIIEELARVDPSFAVFYAVHVGLCSKTIALHGSDALQQEYLSRLSGTDVGAYSLSEAGAGTDAAALSCKAKLSDDGEQYILNGTKMWVTNGDSADIYVLFAKVVDHPDYGVKKHGGTTAFVIERGFDGFSVGKKENKLGIRSSDTCSLVLEDCQVPAANVLGEVGGGFAIAMNALDNSRIGIAAQALGIAQGAFEAALKYAHERETFGKPLAQHQAIGKPIDLGEQAVGRTDQRLLEVARVQTRDDAWCQQDGQRDQELPASGVPGPLPPDDQKQRRRHERDDCLGEQTTDPREHRDVEPTPAK